MRETRNADIEYQRAEQALSRVRKLEDRVADLDKECETLRTMGHRSDDRLRSEEARVAELEEVARRIVTARGHELEVIARMELPAMLTDQSVEDGSDGETPDRE